MDHTYSGGQEKDALTAKPEGISGSTVKLVGIITMLIDHFAAAILGRILISSSWSEQLYTFYTFLRLVGRLGFPIFCFLLVEGFGKTRSKTKYAVRLGLFALISEVPFDLALCAKVLEYEYQNVYFTLFLGMLALCAYDFFSKHRLPMVLQWALCIVGVVLSGIWLKVNFLKNVGFESTVVERVSFLALCFWVLILLGLYGWRTSWERMRTAGMNLAALSFFMLLADFLRTDYSGMGVLTITVIYILRSSKVRAMAGGCLVLTLMSLTEITAFFSLIPVGNYNGRRGLKLKYFFYAFYPVHLLLLWLLAWRMGMGHIPVV